MPYNGTRSPNPPLPSGADALLNLYNPQGNVPQRKTLNDFIRPVDTSTIDAIQSAIGAGLDPSTAAGLLGAIGGGIDTRFGDYRQRRQDLRSQATDALMQLAQTNPNPDAAATYLNSFQTLHPGLGAQIAPTLSDLAGSLYPGGDTSPLFTGDTSSGGGNQGLTQDDISGIYQDAMTFAQGDPANGVSGLPLHDARLRIMGQLRAQGYSDADLETAYNAIGTAYQAVGGNINAPLTAQDRLAQVAAAAQPPAPPAPPMTPQQAYRILGIPQPGQ